MSKIECNLGFSIGKVKIANRCLLAPMAGYGDKAFRQMCRENGAGLSCTEMISCKGLIYKNQQTVDMLSTASCETPSVVQLFGKVCEDFERAVQDPLLANFDIVDINMGCPVNKVIKHGEGSELMETPKLAADIVKTCVKASNGRPVTVKHRLGIGWGDNTSVDFAKRLQDAGAYALVIHGRYQQQLYKGDSDWDAIAKVAQSVDIPIIGSGDVVDRAGFLKALEYQVSAVMVARGAIGNPSIFNQILGLGNDELNPAQVVKLCKRHLELHLEYVKKDNAVAIFKKHFASYLTTLKRILNRQPHSKNDLGAESHTKYNSNYLNQLKQHAHTVGSVSRIFEMLDEVEYDLVNA